MTTCKPAALARRAALAFAVLAVALGGCRPAARVPEPPSAALVRAEMPPALADDGDPGALAAALDASIAYYARLPADRAVAFGDDEVSAGDMRHALERLARHAGSAPAFAAELARRFAAYRAAPANEILFTGYYLPALEARHARDARFRYPVHGRPPDLVTASLGELAPSCAGGDVVGRVVDGKLRPYFDRGEIDAGASRAPVLAWVDDPVALFFLQIQGSGTLVFPERRRRIGFAASNGHPYVSIGKLLVDEGHLALSDASMQGIRRWIAAHPEQRERVLHANPRYVFFRPLDGPIVGSIGAPLTAGRSVAVDPAVYPPGALAFAHVPEAPRTPLARFVLAQDAGAAIRGPGRIDVFHGEGEEAAAVAGAMRAPGELWFFAPRDAIRPRRGGQSGR